MSNKVSGFFRDEHCEYTVEDGLVINGRIHTPYKPGVPHISPVNHIGYEVQLYRDDQYCMTTSGRAGLITFLRLDRPLDPKPTAEEHFNVLEAKPRFLADVESALTARLDEGQRKYGSYFRGDALAQAYEEALDQLFYLWVMMVKSGKNPAIGFPAPRGSVDANGKPLLSMNEGVYLEDPRVDGPFDLDFEDVMRITGKGLKDDSEA